MVRRPSPTGATGVFVTTLVVPPRDGCDLFLGFLFARVSNSRPAWSRRPSARGPVFERRCPTTRQRAFLVCANFALAGQQRSRSDGSLLDWHVRFGPSSAEF